MQRLTRRLLAFVALVCAWIPHAASAAAPPKGAPAASPEDAARYGAPGIRSRLPSGRRLNFVCAGSGSPTVVLEAEGTSYSTAWYLLLPKIAAFTRACAYDRAGYGFSDPGGRPSTAANIVQDLHDALPGAGVGVPFVLVGQLAGGLYATLYADTHRADLAGLVLLDPDYPGDVEAAFAIFTPAEREPLTKAQGGVRAMWRDCADLAKAGDRAAMTAKKCPCSAPPALLTVVADNCAQAKQYETALSENLAYIGTDGRSESKAQEAAAARSFGDLPLLIITRSAGVRPPIFSAETNNNLLKTRWAAHERLASRSTKGSVLTPPETPRALLQIDHSQLIADEVRKLVEAARR